MSFHWDLSTLSTLVSSLRMAFSGQFFTQIPQTLAGRVQLRMPFLHINRAKGAVFNCRGRSPVHLRSKIAICAICAFLP